MQCKSGPDSDRTSLIVDPTQGMVSLMAVYSWPVRSVHGAVAYTTVLVQLYVGIQLVFCLDKGILYRFGGRGDHVLPVIS